MDRKKSMERNLRNTFLHMLPACLHRGSIFEIVNGKEGRRHPAFYHF